MIFKETINFKDEIFTLVQVQRDDLSAIYKAPNGESYLRIGNESKIKNDLKNHQHLIQMQYPVSPILDTGFLEDKFYYLEKSMGNHTFSKDFEDEYTLEGRISDVTFEKFFSILQKHFEAQLANTTEPDWEAVYLGIAMDRAIEERPDLKYKLIARFELAKERLSGVPFSFCHADFNPFNIMEGGVIDFETGHFAPICLDLFSPILYAVWFPMDQDLEINGSYQYTEEQKQRIFNFVDSMLEERGYPKASHLYEEINFLKGVWLAVGLQEWSKFMEWRYKYLETLL